MHEYFRASETIVRCLVQNFKFETVKRMAKVNKNRHQEIIKIKLSTILRKSASNPKFSGVTITGVKLSPDSSSAVINYSVYNSKTEVEQITQGLNKASGFFQAKLSKTLQTRNTPKLKFVFDAGFDHADKIDRLLSQIHRNQDSKQ